jgi:predicted SnoaL-like aldol condensation-catalyzing enzyme
MKLLNLKTFAGAVILAALSCAPLAAQAEFPGKMSKQEAANLKLVLDWWREGFVAGHVEAVDKYLATDMIQHNPNAPNGNAGVKGFLGHRTPLNPIPEKLTPAQMPSAAIARGDIVFIMWDRESKDPTDPSKTYKHNDFDAFRVKDGKIVEHWDGAHKNAPGANRE